MVLDLTIFTSLLTFIQHNGYIIMFFLMFLEGPLVTYAYAFAASIGIYNIYIVFILSVLGNLIPDIIYFFIGRFGTKRFLEKYVQEKHITKIRHLLENHTGKYLALVKIVPPFPFAGLVFAGMSNMSFKKYFFFVLLIGIPYSLFFTLAGFYSGIAFSTLSRYYLLGQLFLLLIVIIGIIFWLLIRKMSNKIIHN
jgi:membrane-associated protein